MKITNRILVILTLVFHSYFPISVLIAKASGMGVSVLPRSVADFTSDKHISRRVIGEADTGIAYVMAWSKNIRNSAAELFIETVRKLSQDEDNVYGI